jgi:hypothetical protein
VVVLLIIAVVFVGSLALFISINRRKAQKLQSTASVMQEFAARNGMRFGRFEPNLPARVPDINDLVGSPRIYVDFQLDGTVHGVPFTAFQVRRPPPPRSAVTFDVSTRTPEFTVVLVPRPELGPPLRLAPKRLPWATALRRDVQIGDPHVDNRLHVSTDTPAFAHHLLQPPLGTWLASDPPHGPRRHRLRAPRPHGLRPGSAHPRRRHVPGRPHGDPPPTSPLAHTAPVTVAGCD